MDQPLKTSIVIFGLLLLAILIRVVSLDAQPIWLDEAYSVWFSSQSWEYLWNEVPQFETHPPLYYSILKLWMGFGHSEFWIRLLSVFPNILTVICIYYFGRMLGGGENGVQIGLLAAFLFALSIQQIHYSLDARPYTFLCWRMP